MFLKCFHFFSFYFHCSIDALLPSVHYRFLSFWWSSRQHWWGLFVYWWLDLVINDVEVVQTSMGAAETSAEIFTKATNTVGTSSGASSHPSNSQSHPCRLRLSRGGPIPAIHNLKTHTWTTHHHQFGSHLSTFAIFIAFICNVSCYLLFYLALNVLPFYCLCSFK